MKISHKAIPFILTLLLLCCCPALMSQEKFILVIDPGHGGRDAGALGSKSKEKDINLAVALKFGKLIETHHPDVKIIYTRKTDNYITLNERADLANKNHANLFISIHANSAENKKAYGTETFTFGLAKTQSNLDVAMRENSVILLEDDYKTSYQGFDPSSVESYIMFEFMQDKYMDRSLEFASYVQNHFAKDCKRHDRGVRQSGFLVLHRSACPSALIELGFISNPEEEKYMISEKGQKELSTAIYRAFAEYKHDHDKKNGILAAQANSNSTITEKDKQSDQKPVFKVQLFITKEKLKSNSSNLKGIKNPDFYMENGWYKYTTGSTSDYDKIQKVKKEVQSKYPDAFVIAFLGDKKISIDEAHKLLKK